MCFFYHFFKIILRNYNMKMEYKFKCVANVKIKPHLLCAHSTFKYILKIGSHLRVSNNATHKTIHLIICHSYYWDEKNKKFPFSMSSIIYFCEKQVLLTLYYCIIIFQNYIWESKWKENYREEDKTILYIYFFSFVSTYILIFSRSKKFIN